MRITAIRHGETEGNVDHIVQSHTGGKLTGRGREQARDAGQSLTSEQFDAIYSSDLQRCIETAELVLVALPDASFARTERLRERSNGEYDGKHWEDLPEFVFDPERIDMGVPGGESWLQVETRIAAFLNELYERYPDGDVLLITHGGPVKVLHSLVEGLTLQQATRGMIPNADIWRGEMSKPVMTTVVS